MAKEKDEIKIHQYICGIRYNHEFIIIELPSLQGYLRFKCQRCGFTYEAHPDCMTPKEASIFKKTQAIALAKEE